MKEESRRRKNNLDLEDEYIQKHREEYVPGMI